MTQYIAPSKYVADFQAGETFPSVQFRVTREMVNFCLIGINDRDDWFISDSPFGGPIAPPVLSYMASLRITAHYMWGDFVGAIFTRPANIHYIYDGEYVDPIRLGELITVKGGCAQTYEKRGRRHVQIWADIYGEDERLCTRIKNTMIPKFARGAGK